MGVKDDNLQDEKKNALGGNAVENLRSSKRPGDECRSGENNGSNQSGAKCPKSSCSGILTQYLSISAYKPWRYHCTSCASEFEYH